VAEQHHETEYFATNNPDDIEARRVELIEMTQDPLTIRRLEGIGIAKGLRCLEIGAGKGSIARWLSERVGPEGSVVATDINTRFLEELDIPNVKVRQHDIAKDGLEENLYDLAHCRQVLMHMSKPQEALSRMVEALRPGGWVLIEETDSCSPEAVDPSHPFAETYKRNCKILLEIVTSSGSVNTTFGRRLPGLVERLGLTDVGHEGTTRIFRGGDPWALHLNMTARMMEEKLGLERLTQAGYKTGDTLRDD